MDDQATAARPLIRKDDFSKVKYCLLLDNTTTRMQIQDSSKIKLVELLEDGVVLELPRNSCSPGHSLLLHFFGGRDRLSRAKLAKLKSSGKKIESFTVTGKVLELGEVGETHQPVTVKFIQLDRKAWDEFLKEFSDEQDKIDRIMASIRK